MCKGLAALPHTCLERWENKFMPIKEESDEGDGESGDTAAIWQNKSLARLCAEEMPA